MDVATPTRGNKKLNTCTRKKKDVSFGGTLKDLDPGVPYSSTWMLSLEVHRHHHHIPRCHLELGFHFGGIYEHVGMCGHHVVPMEAKHPTFLAQHFTYEPQRHPRREWHHP
jgi:hypothetical protein